MADELVLYDHPASPCARRVRIALIEKGLAWRSRVIDLEHMEQKSPWYLALNPNGIVPTLQHGARVVWESNVITEYVDDVFPGPKLYPSDAWERAQAKMWQAFELEMAKEFRPLLYHRLMGPMKRSVSRDEALATARRHTTDPAHLEWTARVYDGEVVTEAEAARLTALLYGRLRTLEERLEGRAFLVGDAFSIADVSVLPRVAMYGWIGLPIDATAYPRVTEWLARLGDRPSFARSIAQG
ncbi:MAG TPA: glutathione S-transferase family protein [Candidatus Eisenbacteria bacterium]|nr:glutathione S-transferase family protein [Candidatus Eisenbacteria bacterium]